ncbi:hypothetical protein [Mesorhizobium sp.]|uniref:hypothetical protein n=1 Tax=Mesorhizobium sp. TaxID=1871066 RepID=UPI0011F590E0|nr:hypothetical protein [Mesorhizobium sp.]TIQ10999.1 MAG: hypothetical protein E5X50_09425 [Mesorhizobium sp.]
MTRTASIPVDVREVMGAILERARQQNKPFGVSEAIDQIRRQFPDLGISDNDLIEALAGEAASADVDIDLSISTENRTGQHNDASDSTSSNFERRGSRRRSVVSEKTQSDRSLDGEAGIIKNNKM